MTPPGTPPAAGGAGDPPPVTIRVTVKSPFNTSVVDFATEFPAATATVGDLKRRIEEQHEGNPPAATQRIIHAGALLRDDAALLKDVLKSADLSVPQVFHMVGASPTTTPARSRSEGVRRSPEERMRPPPGDAATPPSPPPPPPLAGAQPRGRFHQGAATPTPTPPPPPSSGQNGPQRTPDPNPMAYAPTTPPSAGYAPPTPPSPWYGYGYLGIGAQSPQIQAVYEAAYGAAFAALSPTTSPAGGFAPPTAVAVPYPVPVPTPWGAPGGAWGHHAMVGGWGGAQHQHQHQHQFLPPPGTPGGAAEPPAPRREERRDGGGGGGGAENPWVVPGVGPEAMRAIERAAAAVARGDPVAAAREAAAAAVGGRPVHVMQFHVDLRLLFKLFSMVFILSQGASRGRTALYAGVAVAWYIAQMGALRAIARWLGAEDGDDDGGGRGGRGRNGGGGGARGAAADRRGGARPRPPRPGPRTTAVLPGMRDGMPRGWMGEVKVFIGGFLASLLPSWNPPELHRHPRADAATAAAAPRGPVAVADHRAHAD